MVELQGVNSPSLRVYLAPRLEDTGGSTCIIGRFQNDIVDGQNPANHSQSQNAILRKDAASP